MKLYELAYLLNGNALLRCSFGVFDSEKKALQRKAELLKQNPRLNTKNFLTIEQVLNEEIGDDIVKRITILEKGS